MLSGAPPTRQAPARQTTSTPRARGRARAPCAAPSGRAGPAWSVTAPQRASTYVLALFALAAVLLAAVGIYGVRMAMGARAADVMRMIGASGLRLAGTGMALGVAGALAVTRLLESLLHGVTPTDPATFATVGLVLGLVAAAACYVPARRATRIDPLVALRDE